MAMRFNQVRQWVNQGSLKALDQAYQRACAIKAIEDQHFGGKKITVNIEGGKSVFDYFQATLERELLQIRLSLTQFRVNNFLFAVKGDRSETTSLEADILQKLSFIESVIKKYRPDTEELIISSASLPKLSTSETNPNPDNSSHSSTAINSRGWIDLGRELTPEYEQEVIQKLRSLRLERKTALWFLTLLVIIPLIVQIVSKNLIYSPFINWKFVDTIKMEKIVVSEELGEKFLEEFSRYKEAIEIKTLLGIIPEISEEKKRELLKERAKEKAYEAAYKTLNGWKNLLADLTSLGTFALFIYFFRRQFSITRQFISRYFLGLNDVTKVFIFILLTDMFVGFHSAEGWEVLLATTFAHFGLPENHNFIYLFIATIPVILDSIFKLLIFNYLTRKSPTSVAILEKMQQ